VQLLAGMDLVGVDLAVILGAIDLHRVHGLGFWHALILKAASAAGCVELLSEDMQHGQVIEGVEIENPLV
jgi:predicted nucleic acid-binding protein